MNSQRKTLIVAMMALVCWLGVEQAQAAEFSATMVSHVGAQETQGKVYFQGEKMRQEFSSPQGTTISIARPDKMVMWMIMPGQKMYMEMPFSKDKMGKTMEMPEDKAQMKLLGTETVNGYETEKYETTMQGRGRPVQVYMWVSKKLGVPIKMVSQDGSFSMEYRDIKEGSPPAETFEVPQGYQKMTMPQGMHPRR